MKLTLTFPAFLFIIAMTPHWLGAQPCDIPPSTENCESAPILCNVDDLNGYCTAMSSNQTFNGPTPLCPQGGEPFNTQWFAFSAGCTSFELTLNVNNCVMVNGQLGVQIAIYNYGENALCVESSQEPEEFVVCQSTCITSSATLSVNNLTVGNIYYILINGCGGSYCGDLSITLDELCGPAYIGDWPEPISGPLNPCLGNVVVYEVTPPVGTEMYVWYVDGAEYHYGPDPTVEIVWLVTGTYELCVDVSSMCVDVSEYPQPICIIIEAGGSIIGVNPDPVVICEGDLYTYHGDAYPPGYYIVTLPSVSGCDSIVELVVIGIPTIVTDIGQIYLCPEDTVFVGGVPWTYAHQGSNEYTVSQSTEPYCDSTIRFEIIGLYVEAFIFTPQDPGCDFPEVILDGHNSVYGPPNVIVNWKWEAYEGGELGDPSDQPAMAVTTPGKYCLRLEIESPDGLAMCWDSACVVIKGNSPPEIEIEQSGQLSPYSPVVSLKGVGNGIQKYTWFNSKWQVLSSNQSIIVDAPDTYCLYVEDDFECNETVCVEVTCASAPYTCAEVANPVGEMIELPSDIKPDIFCNYPGEATHAYWSVFNAECSHVTVDISALNCNYPVHLGDMYAAVYWFSGQEICPGLTVLPSNILQCAEMSLDGTFELDLTGLTLGRQYYILVYSINISVVNSR